jgi:hypothetical protein
MLSNEAMTEDLPSLAARLEYRVNELRRESDPATLLAAASSAADAIENRVSECWNDEGRAALTAVRRFTYNVAADCWPGWSLDGPRVDERDLLLALQMSQRSARLVEALGLGHVQRGTASWLTGAFHLALGALAEASSSFSNAREHYIAANTPGLVLLTEGYLAIVQRLAPHDKQDRAYDFDKVCSKIAAGGFEDGPEWIEQLRTALKVFT